MSSQTRPSSSRRRQLKSILVSDIKYDSTCVTLNLPLCLACDNCKPKLDVLSNKRKIKNKKKERNKSERRRCLQYWLSKWSIGPLATSAHVLTYRLVRKYLQIEPDLLIQFDCAYDNENKNNNINNNTTTTNIKYKCITDTSLYNTTSTATDTTTHQSTDPVFTSCNQLQSIGQKRKKGSDFITTKILNSSAINNYHNHQLLHLNEFLKEQFPRKCASTSITIPSQNSLPKSIIHKAKYMAVILDCICNQDHDEMVIILNLLNKTIQPTTHQLPEPPEPIPVNNNNELKETIINNIRSFVSKNEKVEIL